MYYGQISFINDGQHHRNIIWELCSIVLIHVPIAVLLQESSPTKRITREQETCFLVQE